MAKDTERWRLISFDIRDPKRYRRTMRILKGYATRLQYSVFRARLDDRQSERLRWELSREMSEEDALLIIELCPHCAGRLVCENKVQEWPVDSACVVILAGNQAPEEPPGTTRH